MTQPARPWSFDDALREEGVTGQLADVARSIYQQESSGGANTRTSNAGARGGMQILPGTFSEVADQGWNIDDPAHNARAGIRYVRQMYERAGGDPALAAAGYYGGPRGLEKARRGVAVSDPRNPNAPTTLEYGRQVAGRLPQRSPIMQGIEAMTNAIIPSAHAAQDVNPWEREWDAPTAEAPGEAPAGEPSALARLGQGVGVGVRGLATGLASIPGIVTDAATGVVNEGLDAVRGEGNGFRFQTARSATNNLLDAVGMPDAQNSSQRIARDATDGAASAAAFFGAGGALSRAAGKVAQGVGQIMAAGPGLQAMAGAAGAGASSATREAGGGQVAQTIAGLAGGMAPAALPYAGQAVARGVLRGGEAGRQRVADNIRMFEDATGSVPTLGQATEGRVQRGAESLLGRAPGGAGVIAKAGERQAERMAEAVRGLSESLAPGANAMTAGESIAKGVASFKAGMQKTQRVLYDKLDTYIAPGDRVGSERTVAALKDLNADIAGAPELSKWFKNARIQGIERALGSDTGGPAAVLTRPGMAEKVAAMRAQLTDDAQRLSGENQRNQWQMIQQADLAKEANRVWRQQLHEEAAAARTANQQWRDELLAEAEAAVARNVERKQLGMVNFEPVQSAKQIKELPDKFPVMSPKEIAELPDQNPVLSLEQIRSMRPPNAVRTADEIEAEITDFLQQQVDNRLPYESVKKLRTLVGKELAEGGLMSDVPRSKWSALYAALSDDLGDAAKAAGPDAAAQWERANTFTRTQMTRLEELKSIIDRDAPEKVFNAALAGTAEGNTIVARVFKAIPKQNRQEVAAAVLQRLGRATAGQQNEAGDAFSSETFLTNLSKLSPGARKTIFGRLGIEGVEQKLASFAKIAESRREGGRVFANPSGTAAASAQLTAGGALVAALASGNPAMISAAVAVPTLSNIAARTVTKPEVVRFAARSTTAAPGTQAAAVGSAARTATAPPAAEPEPIELPAGLEGPWQMDWGSAEAPPLPPEAGAAPAEATPQPDAAPMPMAAPDEPRVVDDTGEALDPTDADVMEQLQEQMGGEPVAAAPVEITQPLEQVEVASAAPVAPVEADGRADWAVAQAPEPPAATDAPEPRVLPGDILNPRQQPFTNRYAALQAAARAGEGYEAVPVEGGFVVRQTALA